MLEDDGDHLEGEVIVSADTAADGGRRARLARPPTSSCCTSIHGMLHLVGYDDKSPADAAGNASRRSDATCDSSASTLAGDARDGDADATEEHAS